MRRLEGMGLTSFIVGIIGLIIAGIILGVLAMIFGIIGILRVSKKPDSRFGKGFAIAGFILGVIDVIAVLIIISILF